MIIKRWIGLLSVAGLFFICSIVGYQLFFRQCLFWACVPTRSFTVFDLGLPMDFFPEDTLDTSMFRPSESLGAIESGTMNIFWREGKGSAVYNVWRFSTEERASKFFKALSNDTSYPEQDELKVRSRIADEYAAGCGLSQFGGYRCDVIARYKEFTISFNATIDHEISVEQFEQIVIYIDEQMRLHLYPESK